MQKSQSRKLHVPRLNQWTRLLAVGFGLLVFLWLSPEDNQIWPVTVLGVGLSVLGVGFMALRRLGGRAIPARYIPVGTVLLGALIGLCASLGVTGLMFFKNALHGHLFLDYPVGMMLAMLGHAPGWALAGGLVGLGTAFIWLAVERN